MLEAACFPDGKLSREPMMSSAESAVGAIASIRTPFVSQLQRYMNDVKDLQLADLYWQLDAHRLSSYKSDE